MNAPIEEDTQILFIPSVESQKPAVPSLEPAIIFENGISQVPVGYFVFLEISTYSYCSTECNCAPGPVRILYNYSSSGELWTDLFDLNNILEKPIVGLFGFGDWHDQLYVIDKLPYKIPPYDAAAVYNVNAEGVAIMEYMGKSFYIKPGQSWTNDGNEKRESPVGCSIAYGSKLTNYGLLTRDKIHFGDPNYHE